MAKSNKKVAKKRVVVVEPVGQAHINASFNNIIISMTNTQGQVISWASAGKMGFKGSKKNTPNAAQMAAQDCGKVAHDLGLRKVEVFVKGWTHEHFMPLWRQVIVRFASSIAFDRQEAGYTTGGVEELLIGIQHGKRLFIRMYGILSPITKNTIMPFMKLTGGNSCNDSGSSYIINTH